MIERHAVTDAASAVVADGEDEFLKAKMLPHHFDAVKGHGSLRSS